MVWIGCLHCEKLRHNFVARTFGLVAPVLPVLHRVPCSNITVPNACKQYEMHQNMSLGSNGVDGMHSLRRIPTQLRCTDFCISCSCSARFAPSFMQVRYDNKYTQTLWNAPKHEFRVQWGGSGALVAKNYNANSWLCFATSFMQLRNDPKCTEILRNGPKH